MENNEWKDRTTVTYMVDLFLTNRHHSLRYPHVTLIFKHQEEQIKMESRHEPDMQKVRRRKLARLRNFLLMSALKREGETPIYLHSNVIESNICC